MFGHRSARRSSARWWIAAGLVTLIVVLGYFGVGQWEPGPARPVALKVPMLSEEARAGQVAFDRVCAGCHGANAAGGPAGPPLVHAIYRPAHHADMTFTLAIRRGVAAHHWRFGNMPPQPAVGEEEIGLIVRYVRELQRANGID